MATDINSLIKEVLSATTASNATISDVVGNLRTNIAGMQAQQPEIAAAGQSALEQFSKGAAASAQAKYTQDLQQQNAQRQAGLDPDDPENKFIQAVAELNRGETELQQAKANYDRVASIGLLDDPVGYIFGQLELPSLEAKYAGAAKQVELTGQNLQRRQALLIQNKQAVTANTADLNREAALGEARMKEFAAKMQVISATGENAARIGAEQMRIISAENTMTDNKIKALQIAMQGAQRAEQRQEHRARMNELNALQEERRLKLAAERQGREQINMRLKALTDFMGLPPTTIEMLDQGDKKTRDRMLAAAYEGKFGNDLGSAVSMLDSIPGASALRKSQPGFSQFLESATQGAKSFIPVIQKEDALNPGAKKKNQTELADEAYYRYQTALVQAAESPAAAKNMTHPDWNGSLNPLRVPHAAVLQDIGAGKSPLDANNVMVKALTKMNAATTAIGGNITVEDEQRALRVVGEMISQRQVDPNEAARMVSAYYKAGADKASNLYNYELAGLKRPNSYFVTIPAGGMFADTMKVDVFNPAMVKNGLLKSSIGLKEGAANMLMIPQSISQRKRADEGFSSLFNSKE